jgi:hypothetical protein
LWTAQMQGFPGAGCCAVGPGHPEHCNCNPGAGCLWTAQMQGFPGAGCCAVGPGHPEHCMTRAANRWSLSRTFLADKKWHFRDFRPMLPWPHCGGYAGVQSAPGPQVACWASSLRPTCDKSVRRNPRARKLSRSHRARAGESRSVARNRDSCPLRPQLRAGRSPKPLPPGPPQKCPFGPPKGPPICSARHAIPGQDACGPPRCKASQGQAAALWALGTQSIA